MKIFKEICVICKQFDVILSSQQKKWAVVIFFMSLVGSVLEMLGVSAIFPLVQAMLNPEEMLKNTFVKSIYRIVGISSARESLVVIAIGIAVIYIMKNMYLCMLSYLRSRFASKVQKELSIKMLNSYIGRGYDFFRKQNTSVLLRGIDGSIIGVYNVLYQFMRIIAEVLTAICILLFVIYTDWQIASGMAVILGITLSIVVLVFKKIMENAGDKYYKYTALVKKYSLQLFYGIKEILVLHRKEYFIKKYEEVINEQQDGLVKQGVAAEIPAYIIEGICVTVMILVVCFRVSNMENPAEYIPQLASFAVAAFRLLPSIGRITSYYNACIFHFPGVEEVYNNIIEAKKCDKIIKRETFKEGKNVGYKKNEGFICINNLVWKYEDSSEIVLNNISLNIQKGESVAFIGSSGAGKSTLSDIILGLFEPTDGEVLINGINVLDQKDNLARIIGYVPQSIYLVDDSIKNNIAFGIDDELIDEDTIWRTLEQVQLKELVETLEDKLETIIGERGIRFSGGQVQRLAIARALYTNPEILILDEATSALDNDTENVVMESIEKLQGKKTLIIIAHRLTTLRNCDKIYEINNGKLVKRKYEELLRD